jgi:hypothetical protein
VFEFDDDFVIYYHWCRQFLPSRERFFIFSLQLHVDEFYFREIREPRTPTCAGTPQGRVQLVVDRPWVLIVNALGVCGRASTREHERLRQVVGFHLESCHGQVKCEPDLEPTMSMMVVSLHRLLIALQHITDGHHGQRRVSG